MYYVGLKLVSDKMKLREESIVLQHPGCGAIVI